MFPSGSFTIKNPVKLKKIIHLGLVAAYTFMGYWRSPMLLLITHKM